MSTFVARDFVTREELVLMTPEEYANAALSGRLSYQSDPLSPEEKRQGERVRQMRNVQDEALELFSRKNRDYGDAFADYGPVGVLVRLGDKLRRAGNISSSGVTLVKDEGLRDTLLDLHNYAAMAIMLLDEEKIDTEIQFE